MRKLTKGISASGAPARAGIRRTGMLAAALTTSLLWAAAAFAQGRGGPEWTTAQHDAQRTGWVRTDAQINPNTASKIQALWHLKFNNQPSQLNSLTSAAIVNTFIGYRGFKAVAYFGGSSNQIFAIDYDLGVPYMDKKFDSPGMQASNSLACPSGITGAPSRPTPLEQPAVTAGGGRGGNGYMSLVGEPGEGAPIEQAIAGRGGAAAGAGRANAAGGANAQGGAAGRGGAAAGRGGAAGGQVAFGAAQAPAGRIKGGGAGFGASLPVYVVSGDGMLHMLSQVTLKELGEPVKFVPANANVSDVLGLSNEMVYAATMNNCGGAPNAVWASDLSKPEAPVTSWKTNGGSPAGAPALGSNDLLYVAIGDGPSNGQDSYSNSVVALDAKTLQPKDWFTAAKADFGSAPVVFQMNDKDYVAEAGRDGKLYLLDGSSLGGSDHKTPLFVTANPYYTAKTDYAPRALAYWQDSSGTGWVLAPAGGAVTNGQGVTNGAIVAFKVVDNGGKPSLQQAWVSRDMVSPLPPAVVNGVVFAASSGEYHPANGTNMSAADRAKRSTPAVLYALDAQTGKELWNSGKTITSFTHTGGLTLSEGQVYLPTYDSTVWAFGIYQPREETNRLP